MAEGKEIKINESKQDVYILGVETSCDDTCASVVRNGNEILSNVVSSQNEIHEKYGGVVPEIASRKHLEMIDIVIKEALLKADITSSRINAVSVTNRPGLLGSLLVGVGAAKAFCYFKNIPLITVNHLKAHIFANILANPEIKGKAISLIVSGGHSSLYIMDEEFNIKEIGHTVDDAVGEAYDKIARYLGLGYPGGPAIDRIAKNGNPEFVNFTRPMTQSGDYNFSFSGIKTALIYLTKKNPDMLKEENLSDISASFQAAAVDALVAKTIRAARDYKTDKILVSGGVAANSRLREQFEAEGRKNNIAVYIPPVFLCMDNAAMVASLGYRHYIKKEFADLSADVFSRTDF
ncbi:MAG TPA: tRNA (adenosine(37)-N6)-threonylcarbamoyltransferase complex transferase subunit TsaD [Actinobacteria bacterium]|nr:tRNA (adenosine(37)-N6)-threonylcarbamoyltransferase complex transferase subunit TsaD [Actinomycetota bacterium]